MIFKILLQCLLIKLSYSISQKPILIVVSYDAFRYDFFETKEIPNLNRLRKLGTSSDYLINAFPTKTFPNHHTIATGLYSEGHGVVGNSYIDPSSKTKVNINSEMFHYDNSIVPIWRRNEDAGKGRYSGIMMWPGGCFPYQGKNVTYCQNYNKSMDFFKRVDMVISWLKDSKKPANLIMMYFEQPDTDAHALGIASDDVDNVVKKLDKVAQYLEKQLEINNLKDVAHVLHLSDHGMLDVTPTNIINVTKYLTPGSYIIAGSSPTLQFHPTKGMETEVYGRLKNVSIQNGNFKVYKKEEYPDRWHYKNNPRSPPILALADRGFAFDDLTILIDSYLKKEYNLNVTNHSMFGVHGYDYTVEEMRPFFMARGPKIKVNNKVPPFDNVDLFNLFCEILEITPTKNSGKVTSFPNILTAVHNGHYSLSTILTITAGGITITLILIICAAVLTLMMIKRQQSITTTAALNKRFPQTFQSSIEAQHLLEPEDA